MRKIVAITMITLDGVMQAPGSPEEDTSGGFKYGGWSFPYFDDFFKKVEDEGMRNQFDLLLGKKTYDIFAAYWPHHKEPGNTVGIEFDKATKYVASDMSFTPIWDKTVILEGEIAEAVKKLKAEDGPELQIYGSGNFLQTLLKHDLVDELRLTIFPITLGTGKKLFAEGTIPAAFKLSDSKVSPKGVIFAKYERAGEIQIGSFV